MLADKDKHSLYVNWIFSFGMIKYNGSKELSDEEIISLRSLTIAKSPSPIKSHSTKSINNQVEKK